MLFKKRKIDIISYFQRAIKDFNIKQRKNQAVVKIKKDTTWYPLFVYCYFFLKASSKKE